MAVVMITVLTTVSVLDSCTAWFSNCGPSNVGAAYTNSVDYYKCAEVPTALGRKRYRFVRASP